MENNQSDLPVTFDIAHTTAHFEQILDLQQQNHYSSVSAEQQEQDGFVFASHNLELLQLMAQSVPQVIALAGGKVVGYNLAMTAAMEQVLPSLAPMFAEFKRWSYAGKPLMDYQFIVGGQVCVDTAFRGRGLIKQLYQQTRDLAGAGYEMCVTEISTRNVNSLKAHQRIGFDVIGVYNDGLENWNLVVWPFK
jgi:GNAT superfamily N-acetyltransferase